MTRPEIISVVAVIIAVLAYLQGRRSNRIAQDANCTAKKALAYEQNKDARNDDREAMEKSAENPMDLKRPLGS